MRHPPARPRVILLFTLVTLTIPPASMASARVGDSKDYVLAGPAVGALCGATERAGWPQQINRSGHYLSGAPVTVDLDGDGAQEIVAADVSGRVWVWKQDGQRMQHWPQRAFYPILGSPSVGDIDGDGEPEIVATTLNASMVYAWHLDGRPVGGFPKAAGLSANDQIRGSAVLVNLDTDPALEIVVATADGYVHAYDAPFAAELPGWPRTLDFNIQTTPAVGDLDGDGQPEIVVRSLSRLHVLNAAGSPIAGWPIESPGSHSSPVVGDLDGDGRNEIVDGQEHAVIVYHGDGTVLSGLGVTGLYYSFFALGDLDGDGSLEAFVGNQGGSVYGFGPRSNLLPGWPVGTGGAINTSPLVFDVDGDGDNEVVAGSMDGFLYAWNFDGTPACGPIDVGGSVFVSPAVGDLDGNGEAELVVAAITGQVHVFDLHLPWNPQRAGWPMIQADARHTGRAP